MSKKTKVLMLYGGESSEHDVSIMSAKNVYAAIDDRKYQVELCYIDKTGKWWLSDSSFESKKITQLIPILGEKSFISVDGGHVSRPDVIFPILHGKNGEDGTVQGLADLMHLPIVGCDMTASAVGMDKIICKRVAESIGVPVVEFDVYQKENASKVDYEKISNRFGGSLFIKPFRSGSSVGANSASSQESLDNAIKEALKYDDVVLIEKNVSPRELEVAVLGNGSHIQVSTVGEVQADGEFYSYESKYSKDSKSAVIIPAKIDKNILSKIQGYAKSIFQAIGGSGLARVDFFLTDDDTVYFDEINTLPGFTNISMYPKLWMHAGVSYPDLIDKLIKLALQRNQGE